MPLTPVAIWLQASTRCSCDWSGWTDHLQRMPVSRLKRVWMLGILLLGASYGALAIPDASAPGSGTLPPRYSQEFVWPDEQGSMPADAELIATKAEISILIEGWPRKPEPLPQAGRPNRKLTVSAALSDLAERYDYTWELSRSGVVLFRKRFSDEHSRPEATHAELRESVRDMLSAIGRLT